MIQTFTKFDEFAVAARDAGVDVNLGDLLKLDLLFFEPYKKYLIINLKQYGDSPDNILILSKDVNLYYSSSKLQRRDLSLYKSILSKKNGESTVLAHVALRNALKNYASTFSGIDSKIDSFGPRSSLDSIEETTELLRKVSDRVEDFLSLLMSLEDGRIKEVETKYLSYDYDVTLARSRLLMDRCRNHLMELRDIRDEINIKFTRQLNKSIEKLTVVMAFLALASLAISIPNTVATFFGIPAFSETISIDFMLLAMVVSLVIVIGWSYYYWKKEVE